MPFFLEALGVKLAKFIDDPNTPEIPPVDPIPQPSVSSISPCGFEIIQHDNDKPLVDFSNFDIRAAVFRSFDNIGLFIEDTKHLLKLKLSITDNNGLVMIAPTINHICSKMHIEDISPVIEGNCNHDNVNCKEAHYDDGALLIELDDYLLCNEKKATFRVKKSMLYILLDSKWSSMGTKVKLHDGFYSLKLENFN